MTKVAIVQTVPQFMNLEASLNRAIELIGEAVHPAIGRALLTAWQRVLIESKS